MAVEGGGKPTEQQITERQQTPGGRSLDTGARESGIPGGTAPKQEKRTFPITDPSTYARVAGLRADAYRGAGIMGALAGVVPEIEASRLDTSGTLTAVEKNLPILEGIAVTQNGLTESSHTLARFGGTLDRELAQAAPTHHNAAFETVAAQNEQIARVKALAERHPALAGAVPNDTAQQSLRKAEAALSSLVEESPQVRRALSGEAAPAHAVVPAEPVRKPEPEEIIVVQAPAPEPTAPSVEPTTEIPEPTVVIDTPVITETVEARREVVQQSEQGGEAIKEPETWKEMAESGTFTNEQLVAAYLTANSNAIPKEMEAALGMTNSKISTALKKLEIRGEVMQSGYRSTGKRGHPPVQWSMVQPVVEGEGSEVQATKPDILVEVEDHGTLAHAGIVYVDHRPTVTDVIMPEGKPLPQEKVTAVTPTVTPIETKTDLPVPETKVKRTLTPDEFNRELGAALETIDRTHRFSLVAKPYEKETVAAIVNVLKDRGIDHDFINRAIANHWISVNKGSAGHTMVTPAHVAALVWLQENEGKVTDAAMQAASDYADRAMDKRVAEISGGKRSGKKGKRRR